MMRLPLQPRVHSIAFGLIVFASVMHTANAADSDLSSVVHIAPYHPIQAARSARLPATKPAAAAVAAAAPVGASAATGSIAASIVPPASLSPSESVVTTAPVPSLDFDNAYRLAAGMSLQTQLREWAQKSGWNVIWNLPRDWIVPGDAAYGPDFQAAATHVIQELAAAGVDVRADLYSGNRTLVVHEAGASE
ncbi:toxin co-regulated pilus biosynthesis Q family protein [Burkholderia cenocepacia]|uniref:toxin co-regulated pilus biosynthesis Q family protein n=1 Tax=Burkholderia cenocepacia TaxID=95486 RepID=UPI00222F2453|nr:toxin co-regulated pilus biosynthesis Q family protein [Burkholderia cenocepacia]MCW3632875.1 toxin co-regulated pilus biosynthesis Q family protein [Burkholderia cenocepacia]MCW5182343.1 toxin co-regulated pilus biosynthesis Q family protein [Burkholderia cenocepacia]